MVLRGGERRILVVVGLGVVSLGVVSEVDSTLLKNLDMVISVGCTRQSSILCVGRSSKDTREL